MVFKYLSQQNRPSVQVELNSISYFPGQLVTGLVIVNLPKPFIFPTGSIVFRGVQHSCIQFSNQSNTITYHDMEEYFCFEQELLEDRSERAISTGRYVIPFSFLLPEDIPTSVRDCQGSHSCEVKYYIKIVLDNSYFFASSHNAEYEVIVTRPYNVGTYYHAAALLV